MKKSIFPTLNNLILIQQPIAVTDNIGGQKIDWKNHRILWARFEQINHLGPQMRSKDFGVNFYKFTIRNQSQFIKGMRIKMGKRTFKLQSVNMIQSNKNYLELIVLEKVQNEFRN